MKKLMMIGASGHGKVAADIAVKNGYEEISFLDDDPSVTECAGFPVAGRTEDAEKYADRDFFVAVGNAAIRSRSSMNWLKKNCGLPRSFTPTLSLPRMFKSERERWSWLVP